MSTYHLMLEAAMAGHVLHVRIAKPVSSLGWDAPTARESHDLLAEWEFDDRWRVMVLEIEGGPAASGAAPCAADQQACAAFASRLGEIDRPVVAALHGCASGFALELALACDVRVGAAGASFAMDQVSAGVMPFAGGTQRLPRLLGTGRALDMVLTGDAVAAQEALQCGLVQRLAAAGQVALDALTLANRMASCAPVAMRYTKEAVLQGSDMPLEQALKMELDLYLMLFDTQDRREGIAAFQARRAPQFEGC